MNTSGPPGWYPDPYRRFELRYFNGQRWTNDVSAAGRRMIDSGEAVPWQQEWPGQSAAPAPPQSLIGGRPRRGMAVASFVLATCAVLVGWVPFVFAVAAVAVVLAVIFGVLGLRRARIQDGAGRGFAIAGLAISVAATAACVGGLFFTRWVIQQVDQYDHPGAHTLVEGACAPDGSVVAYSGTIRNDETDTRSYELTVTYVVRGETVQTAHVDVRNVEGGATRSWKDTQHVIDPQVECRVTAVHGPSLFGARR